MDKKESFYWDVVKGVAIFLMLWGHCIQYCALDDISYMSDRVFRFIYSFHMPVFMLVSGYLFSYSFQKRNMEDLLTHRIRTMLHPLVAATILNNILLQIPGYLLSNRVDILFGTLFHGIDNSLWFLWTVLYSSLIVGVCCKLTEKTYLQLLLLAAGAFVILLVPQWNMTLFMYPYFVAGFFCGKYRNGAKKIYKMVRYAMPVLFFVLLTFYQKKHYIYVTPMYSEELGLAESLRIAAFRCLIGFVGSLSLMAVVEALVRLGARAPVLEKFLRGISRLGRNSLQMYCLSASLLSGYLPHLYRKFVGLIGGNLFAKNWVVYDFFFTPLIAAASAVCLYGIVVLMKKCRFHRLVFGR